MTDERLQTLLGYLLEAYSITKHIQGRDFIGHTNLGETAKKIARIQSVLADALITIDRSIESEIDRCDSLHISLGAIRMAMGRPIDLDEMDGDPMDDDEDEEEKETPNLTQQEIDEMNAEIKYDSLKEDGYYDGR